MGRQLGNAEGVRAEPQSGGEVSGKNRSRGTLKRNVRGGQRCASRRSAPPESERILEKLPSVDQTKSVRSEGGPDTAEHADPRLRHVTACQPTHTPGPASLPPESERILENQESVDQTRDDAKGGPDTGEPAEWRLRGVTACQPTHTPGPASLPPESKPIAENQESVDQTKRDAYRRWMEICLPGVHGLQPECQAAPVNENESPASDPVAENGETVDQKDRDRVEQLAGALRVQAKLFVRQGSVVATWRKYKGKRLGPYYRPAYREEGRQKSIYLGASAWVAEQVRRLLAKLHAPLREHRALQRAKGMIRVSLREHQARARSLFAFLGVRLKGLEYRGLLRHLRQLTRIREALARERRTAAAWRVITGGEQGGSRMAEVGGGAVGRGVPETARLPVHRLATA